MAQTQTVVEPEVSTTDTGPEDVAHFVRQSIPGNDIATAVIEGTEVTALCGYRWVPYRNPEGRPVCMTCIERMDLE